MKKYFLKNKYKGTGFIELIIYMAVAIIMLAAISSFVISNKKMEGSNKAIAEVEFQGADIVSIVTQAVRNSQSINSPAAGVSGSTLSIVTDTAENNPTIFDLSDGKIRIKEGNSSAIELNSDQVEISNLNFQNLADTGAPGSIRISFDIHYLNPGNKPELNYQKTYYDSASLRQQ